MHEGLVDDLHVARLPCVAGGRFFLWMTTAFPLTGAVKRNVYFVTPCFGWESKSMLFVTSLDSVGAYSCVIKGLDPFECYVVSRLRLILYDVGIEA